MMAQVGSRAVNIDRAALRLTDAIFGYDQADVGDALRAIAAEIGILHIAYLSYACDKNWGASLPSAMATYSSAWQTRYFLNNYVYIDPVVTRGRKALLPFDWDGLAEEDPTLFDFFADATRHGVGRNGVSIPVRKGLALALVSFTSDDQPSEWARYKRTNMASLQKLSFLVDFGGEPEIESSPRADQAVAARAGLFDLGRARTNVRGDLRRPGYRVRQR